MEDCASPRGLGLASWSLPLQEALTASAHRMHWPTAPWEGQQAALERQQRQLGDVEERVQSVSDRLEAMEQMSPAGLQKILTTLDSHRLLPRLSLMERMCEEVQHDAEGSRCKLDLRIDASVARLRHVEAERWEQWERRTFGLERRVADLEESAAILEPANLSDEERLDRLERFQSQLAKKFGACEEDLNELRELVSSEKNAREAAGASKGGPDWEKRDDRPSRRRSSSSLRRSSSALTDVQDLPDGSGEGRDRPEGRQVSVHWMLDLDKQLWDLCAQVDKLDEQLQAQQTLGAQLQARQKLDEQLTAELQSQLRSVGGQFFVADKHDSNINSLQGTGASKGRPDCEKRGAMFRRESSSLSSLPEEPLVSDGIEEGRDRPEGRHVSAHRKLDLDKQLFDLCQQVGTLGEKLRHVGEQQSVADEHISNINSLQVALGKVDSKTETIEACCQDLSRRVVDLERLSGDVWRERDAAPALVDADLRDGARSETRISL